MAGSRSLGRCPSSVRSRAVACVLLGLFVCAAAGGHHGHHKKGGEGHHKAPEKKGHVHVHPPKPHKFKAKMNKKMIASMLKLESAKVESTHSDEWCDTHHLGVGASSCVIMKGCCFGASKTCESCGAHDKGWCAAKRAKNARTCLIHRPCKWVPGKDGKKGGKCVAREKPNSDVKDCMKRMKQAILEQTDHEKCVQAKREDCKYWYLPKCKLGKWAPLQGDLDGQWFCVDENGHEIPTTRVNDRKDAPDCEKQRMMFHGFQCPNAESFSLGHGRVVENLNSGENCLVDCNTDADCINNLEFALTGKRELKWCCSNGCGRQCLKPMKPFASCKVKDVPEHVVPMSQVDRTVKTVNHGGGMVFSCEDDYDAVPLDGPQEESVYCTHGKWDEINLKCMPRCPEFTVKAYHNSGHEASLNERDYVVEGDGESEGNTRTIKCPKGYGATGGSTDELVLHTEKVTCESGEWRPKFDLRCSVCYDAPLYEWKDKQGRGCTFYHARPTYCATSEGARKNCRRACNTCEEAYRQYKRRERRKTLKGVKNPKHWHRKRVGHRVKKVHTVTKNVKRLVETKKDGHRIGEKKALRKPKVAKH